MSLQLWRSLAVIATLGQHAAAYPLIDWNSHGNATMSPQDVYYDCQGGSPCAIAPVKYCDLAVNNMERGSHIYIANEAVRDGHCWGNGMGNGCNVNVRGTDQDGNNCQITGDDMWWSYQDIRAHCPVCGTKHFGNGCMVSVNYHTGCPNRE